MPLGEFEAVEPSQDGPGDVAFAEVDTNEKAAIVEPLTIGDFTAHGRLAANLYFFTKFPSIGRVHTSSTRADVVDIGSFVPFGVHQLQRRDVHHHAYGESSFFSASEAVAQIHGLAVPEVG